MSRQCKEASCPSHAINIAPKSGLCDVHFYKVQRDELLGALTGLRDAIESGKEPALADANRAIRKAKRGDV